MGEGCGNYAGDVLNFSAATARLRAQGMAIESLAVSDDIASAPIGRNTAAAELAVTWSCSRSPARPPRPATTSQR